MVVCRCSFNPIGVLLGNKLIETHWELIWNLILGIGGLRGARLTSWVKNPFKGIIMVWSV